jgi:adenosylcobinamide kinase/adenosylcobinamide-phosphate guanylyltransferase
VITFVVGGTRSGKSGFALRKAATFAGRKAYIATAEALDDEMRERISAHRAQRGEEWDTFEEPLAVTEVLTKTMGMYGAILLDCLTLWLSNVMLAGKGPDEAIAGVISVLSRADERSDIYIVSDEVGLGIVPENEIGRRFRDLAGSLNQKVAEVADEVYLIVAGLPLKLK